jgi:hypothetical protein
MTSAISFYHTFVQEDEQLVQEIYTQLLELYIFDLEVELLAEKLKNVNIGIPPIRVPYPWEQSPSPGWPTHPPVLPYPWEKPTPVWYGPYYTVTS